MSVDTKIDHISLLIKYQIFEVFRERYDSREYWYDFLGSGDIYRRVGEILNPTLGTRGGPQLTPRDGTRDNHRAVLIFVDGANNLFLMR